MTQGEKTMNQAELAQTIQPVVVDALSDLAKFIGRFNAAVEARTAWDSNPIGECPPRPSKTSCPDTIDRGDAIEYRYLTPERILIVRDWYAAQTSPALILFCLHDVPKAGPVRAGSIAQYYAAAYKLHPSP
jgi:hypothetical protein